MGTPCGPGCGWQHTECGVAGVGAAEVGSSRGRYGQRERRVRAEGTGGQLHAHGVSLHGWCYRVFVLILNLSSDFTVSFFDQLSEYYLISSYSFNMCIHYIDN